MTGGGGKHTRREKGGDGGDKKKSIKSIKANCWEEWREGGETVVKKKFMREE